MAAAARAACAFLGLDPVFLPRCASACMPRSACMPHASLARGMPPNAEAAPSGHAPAPLHPLRLPRMQTFRHPAAPCLASFRVRPGNALCCLFAMAAKPPAVHCCLPHESSCLAGLLTTSTRACLRTVPPARCGNAKPTPKAQGLSPSPPHAFGCALAHSAWPNPPPPPPPLLQSLRRNPRWGQQKELEGMQAGWGHVQEGGREQRLVAGRLGRARRCRAGVTAAVVDGQPPTRWHCLHIQRVLCTALCMVLL